jgi:hypothetical protein
MPDYDAAATALEFVPDEVLAAKEPACPTGVPFRELARFVRAKAGQMLAAGEGAVGSGSEAVPRLRPVGSR